MHKKKLAEEERKRMAAKEDDSDSDASKTLSRNNHCVACSEKWKQPLPQPRPYARKNSVTGVDPSLLKCFLSKSSYMITQMIKDEVDKMEQRKIKKRNEDIQKRNELMKQQTKNLPKNQSENTRRSSYLLRKAKMYAQYHGQKPMERPGMINNLNLAKIKNQISIKENVKKIKKFLDEPLPDL